MTLESSSELGIRLQKLPQLSGDVFTDRPDLNEYVLTHSSSCYFIKVKGESMESLNIHDGDLLVVDRSLSPKDKDLVIATENEEFRLMQASAYNAQQYSLDYELANIVQPQPVQVWGVITHVIHHCR
ncbi:MAG: S24 family peptidase [Bacteroidota bacterium]